MKQPHLRKKKKGSFLVSMVGPNYDQVKSQTLYSNHIVDLNSFPLAIF